jgi:hypothetical protein
VIFVNTHPELVGKHALLSPSKHSWLNYDDEKLRQMYVNSFASQIGTIVHDYAADKIFYRQPLEDNRSERNALLLRLLKNGIPPNAIQLEKLFTNLLPYVNDAIGFKMSPEICLYYTDNAFGWVDTIAFSRNVLRIHDLKTGDSPVSMDQLMCYAAYFYLTHKKEANLQKCKTELRIYQNNQVLIHTPSAYDISCVMDAVVHADMIVDEM